MPLQIPLPVAHPPEFFDGLRVSSKVRKKYDAAQQSLKDWLRDNHPDDLVPHGDASGEINVATFTGVDTGLSDANLPLGYSFIASLQSQGKTQ